MAVEDKFAGEMLSEENSDKVTSGTIAETVADNFTLDLFGNIKICYNSIGDKNENDRASG